ncbi:GMC oxidoreductase [Nostoc sp.]|uniref:GMC oxidoreductase n=1 Tax=Nostoc sp. TaxID=1180 RepID=UPI002FF9F5E9
MVYKFSGRRRFLQTTALFSASLAASIARTRFVSASDESVEAIVVGSGFGGAVAALRLGKAGIKTLVLERGRRWPITSAQNTFATYRNPDGRSAWLNPTTVVYDPVPIDVYTGILERLDENGISVLCGAGVGGGSLVYNGMMYQPSRELFYRVFPHSIDYDELDKIYFPRVRSIVKLALLPQDILATSYYLSTRIFLEQATVAGLPNRLIDMALDWNIIRQEINGEKVPSAIIGEDWTGLNSGAKNSLDKNYLPQAEQTGNVEIMPLHIVTEITEVTGHGYRVFCNQINESGQIINSKSITCRYLFLAAGSMGTSKLLVKAKATGTLSRLNNYVGQGWAGNGDNLGSRSGLAKPTNPGQGGTGSGLIEHFDNPLGPISLESYATWNAPDGTLTSLGMVIPETSGSFEYNWATDSVKLNWPSESLAVKKILHTAAFTYNILDRKNANSTHHPQTETILGMQRPKSKASAATTPHPLGGAVLGKVCDLYGRVINYQGLYIVDGSLIPGSSACANPAFTIAALAERCMDRIIADIS